MTRLTHAKEVNSRSCSSDDQKTTGGIRLALATIAMVLTWVFFLPWLAKRPTVEGRLNWLEDRKIDPSAMYYTELEAMDGILERLERSR